MLTLHDNLTEAQFDSVDSLFVHNLDVLKESNDVSNYNKLNSIYAKMLDLDTITYDDLAVIIELANDELYIFVENFVDEEFNDFYHSSIASSFELLRRLKILAE